jgi:hypothetical protein
LHFNTQSTDILVMYACNATRRYPTPAETFVVVSRKDYIVLTYEISAKQFALLDALIHGKTVGDAAHACQIELTQAFVWIREWVFYGFVVSLRNQEAA